MRSKSWVLLWLALFFCAGLTPGLATVRPQTELSMLVTGSIDIERDGTVSSWLIDRADALPKGVVGLVEKSAPGWRFEPVLVQGKPVQARTVMTLRIVAKQLQDKSYAVDIRGAYFGGNDHQPGEGVSAKTMKTPRYPLNAMNSGVSGTVYLVLRIGRDGTVAEAVAEQTNLRVTASAKQMQAWRGVLERSALGAARAWLFVPPSAGDEVDAAWWSVRVPVDFTFAEKDVAPSYGQWDVYVPGPRKALPWQVGDAAGKDSADAYAAGSMTMGGQARRLLTPLARG